uniref:Uncharacterized protein n=1 Tax=Arundo donax TaxID=35708 RepID=A0A0A9AEN2_ARUDO
MTLYSSRRKYTCPHRALLTYRLNIGAVLKK